ncbi:type II restriction endonuclease subunit M [Picosynechococcus sp. PCC 7003]|uniref:class I SAM-dependent DNA methyltransferase n=1 Tax=Picosynechococcus sp. PCC 7003 TaxID=374981 RepID=UPI00081060F7|nr:DNA methyltransferase [Picosynechococcus sp. PCC 7003]ANV84777.1 type II restriction endonuclease subunit M [Picosynechococcus sp. PCC 7003]
MTDFIQKWAGSEGNERANYQTFLNDFCEFLGVEPSPPKGRENNYYCFDRDVKIIAPSGVTTTNFIDFYKEGCFVLEAKQGSNSSNKGTGKRGTATYRKEMKKAFGQARTYARFVTPKPPFLITCDIGDHFRVWQDFSESWLSANGNYGTYDSVPKILFTDLEKPDVKEFFYKIFTDPQSLNPEKIAAQVTREVAADLADLAKTLEKTADPQVVAQFLMRCIFTMFAEDVGLLKEQLFTEALESRWLLKPQDFKPQVEALWQAMNGGTSFGFHGQLLRFNGGLFANPQALELTAEQLKILLKAAERDWKNVEPAIFGTLLERALEKKERSKLGAHYTPRAYVERLVRPVIIEPLQEKWQLLQGEVETLLEEEEAAKSAAAKTKKRQEAAAKLTEFLGELRQIRVLDPACGSGNFLYVTMDLMKTLELEVLNRLGTVLGSSQLRLDFDQVNPSQFLGIEINPRAAEIADLVIWIGYLQWHFRLFGNLPPVEPVLREYKNIECRDAVLDYDGTKPAIDPKTGKVRTRWGGRTMRHPVTGEDVPDPSDQVKILEYINPREAQWQQADYIVSNPPFLGTKKMRTKLGDGYVDSLVSTYSKTPANIDYVMYWWNRCGELLSQKSIKSFGLITSNSISQIRNRQVVCLHTHRKKRALSISFAIPDHPWVDEEEGAAQVRIAMTTAHEKLYRGRLGKIIQEIEGETPEEKASLLKFSWSKGIIYDDLRIGVDIIKAASLQSNSQISYQGCKLVQPRRNKGEHWARGFLIQSDEVSQYKSAQNSSVIRPYLSGDDITGLTRNAFVIDFFGYDSNSAQQLNPTAYQRIVEQIRPHREQSTDRLFREKWWLFGRTRPAMRQANQDLKRYIVTSEVSKHRFFIFVDSNVLPDGSLIILSLEDAFTLGIVSSQIHICWTLAMGGTLEDRPRYNNSVCFDPFPFPDPSAELKQEIRELGERLDSHRKQVQGAHPEVTITAMYNCLEKMRRVEPFTDADREFNNKALITTLKQIHDDLDRLVFQAYGWDDLIPLWQKVYGDLVSLPKGGAEGGGMEDLEGCQTEPNNSELKEQLEQTILQRLVDLNAERAEEERNGFVRWLRPEYQAPDQVITQKVIEGLGVEEEKEEVIAPPEQQKFPTKLKDQLAAIRDLLRTQGSEWTQTQISAQFKGSTKTKAKAIPICLEILEDLGVIFSHTEAETKRYYAAEIQIFS